MEALGSILNYVGDIDLSGPIDVSGYASIMYFVYGGEVPRELTECLDAEGTGEQSLPVITKYYLGDASASVAWTEVVQEASDTTGTFAANAVILVHVNVSSMSPGYTRLRFVASGGASWGSAVLYGLSNPRHPSRLGVVSEGNG